MLSINLCMTPVTDTFRLCMIIHSRRSTSSYLFLGGNLVNGEIKRKVWLLGLRIDIILNDLKVKYESHIKLFCDNNSIISIARNRV
ncbi:hypothetical protein CR513_39092, partial [Mucuna pruriens]